MSYQEHFPFPQLRNEVYEVLKRWNGAAPEHTLLPDLQLVQQANTGDLRKAIHMVIVDAMAVLQNENPRQHNVLNIRFLGGKTVYATANQLNLAESTTHKEQRLGIDRLTEILQEKERTAYDAYQFALEQRLPPASQDCLVGTEESVQKLLELVSAQNRPWLIGVEGIGGIGKTTLAREVARQVLMTSRFVGFAWVTARQDAFGLDGTITPLDKPSLTTRALVDEIVVQLTENDPVSCSLPSEEKRSLLKSLLHERPHLIVIDNLETLIDIQSLLPTLQEWVNPTKILFTSRERYGSEPGIYHFAVPTLSESDALQLVRQEGAFNSLEELQQVSDDELRPIYETVGGNPLAIRLLVGQLHVHDLNSVLADLTEWRGETAENLYTYLFRQAWENLDETSRLVWIRMPLLIGQNATVEQLSTISNMAPEDVRNALAHLVCLNLINRHGKLQNRYYSIHSLTRTFLHKEVVAWQ